MVVFAVLRSTLDGTHLDFTILDKVEKKNRTHGFVLTLKSKNAKIAPQG